MAQEPDGSKVSRRLKTAEASASGNNTAFEIKSSSYRNRLVVWKIDKIAIVKVAVTLKRADAVADVAVPADHDEEDESGVMSGIRAVVNVLMDFDGSVCL